MTFRSTFVSIFCAAILMTQNPSSALANKFCNSPGLNWLKDNSNKEVTGFAQRFSNRLASGRSKPVTHASTEAQTPNAFRNQEITPDRQKPKPKPTREVKLNEVLQVIGVIAQGVAIVRGARNGQSANRKVYDDTTGGSRRSRRVLNGCERKGYLC